MYKYLSMLLLSAFLFLSCSEDTNLTEPLDILKQSFDKSVNVKSAEYTIDFKFKAPNMDNELSAKVVISRDTLNAIYPMKVYAEYKDGTKIAYQNENFILVDVVNKKYIRIKEDQEPSRFLVENFLNSSFEMIAPITPYETYISEFKDSMKLESIVDIDGVKAYLLTSSKFYPEFDVYASMKMYVRKSDLLRIKEEIYQVRGNDTVSYISHLKDVKLDVKINESQFILDKPEGFVEEDLASGEQQSSVDVGSVAPDFQLKDESGKIVTLANFKGKVLILDFWGTWCKWCVKAMPELQKVHSHFEGKNALVLGISCQEPAGADPVKFKKDNNVSYKTLLEGDQTAVEYGVTGFPTLFVIGKDGTILYRKSGFTETMAQELIDLITPNL